MWLVNSELGRWVVGAWYSAVGGCHGLHACMAFGWPVSGVIAFTHMQCNARVDQMKVPIQSTTGY